MLIALRNSLVRTKFSWRSSSTQATVDTETTLLKASSDDTKEQDTNKDKADTGKEQAKADVSFGNMFYLASFFVVTCVGGILAKRNLDQTEKFYYIKSLIHQSHVDDDDSFLWINLTDILKDKGMHDFNLGFVTDFEYFEFTDQEPSKEIQVDNNIEKYNIQRRSGEVKFTIPIQKIQINPLEMAIDNMSVKRLITLAKRKTDMTDNILKTAITIYAATVFFGLTQSAIHFFDSWKEESLRKVCSKLGGLRLISLPVALIIGAGSFYWLTKPVFDFQSDFRLPENKYFVPEEEIASLGWEKSNFDINSINDADLVEFTSAIPELKNFPMRKSRATLKKQERLRLRRFETLLKLQAIQTADKGVAISSASTKLLEQEQERERASVETLLQAMQKAKNEVATSSV